MRTPVRPKHANNNAINLEINNIWELLCSAVPKYDSTSVLLHGKQICNVASHMVKKHNYSSACRIEVIYCIKKEEIHHIFYIYTHLKCHQPEDKHPIFMTLSGSCMQCGLLFTQPPFSTHSTVADFHPVCNTLAKMASPYHATIAPPIRNMCVCGGGEQQKNDGGCVWSRGKG